MSAVLSEGAGTLVTTGCDADGIRVITARGVLDTATYLPLRDTIIEAALDGACAVIVDVTELVVPAPSAWAVFTSARWHIGEWPDVPMALVCADRHRRLEIARNGITRYVAVYEATTKAAAALSSLRSGAHRRRVRTELTHALASIATSRQFVGNWLTAWYRTDLIPVAKLIVTALVENALTHTTGAPGLRIECKDDLVTIAVEDASGDPAVRRELSTKGADGVSGLAIVAAMSRAWGNSPTLSGKTVWATIGPENRL
ncbi:MAG: hypothetical protein QOH57_2492 [Mycobacterium sp.]|nr:hypothetical protein [Mycobacterium sp.]